MSVELLGVDVTDDVLQTGGSSGSQSGVIGLLVAARRYVLADNQGEYNPFNAQGLFFRNDFRNEQVTETGVDQRGLFKGNIKKATQRYDQNGYQTQIQATEPIGTLLDFVVEENDISTHAGFQLSASGTAGDQTVAIDTGTTNLTPDLPLLVTFGSELVPRYQINESTGTPTTSITLDRPLEKNVADNTTLRISKPALKTIPEALSDALVSVGLGPQLGSSFQTLSETDASSNLYIRLMIRTEDNIKLSGHIEKLLELGNLQLTVSENGILDIVRDIAYDGRTIVNEITSDEVIDPWEIRFVDDKLIIGYDLLYLDGESAVVASGDALQELIDQWKGRNRWQPISASSTLAAEYKYLYPSSTAADYFGELRLEYYGAPRVRMASGLKQSRARNVLERYTLQIGKEYALSMPISSRQNFFKVPARILAFTYNETNQVYDRIEVELTNYPTPNIPVEFETPQTPIHVASYGADEAVVSVFEAGLQNVLYIEIYLSDQVTKLTTQEVSFHTQGDGSEEYVLFESAILNNGTTYYAKYFILIAGDQSDSTDFIEFVPFDRGDAEWDTDDQWNFTEWTS